MIETFLERRVGLRGVNPAGGRATRGLEERRAGVTRVSGAHSPKGPSGGHQGRPPERRPAPSQPPSSSRESGVRALPFSSHSGEGREALWKAIAVMGAGPGRATYLALTDVPRTRPR